MAISFVDLKEKWRLTTEKRRRQREGKGRREREEEKGGRKGRMM